MAKYSAKYHAEEVADYIIGFSRERNNGVLNVKLQKLMYLLWVGYYNKTGKYLFSEPFTAEKQGPFIKEAANAYVRFPVGLSVKPGNPLAANASDAEVVDPILEELLGRSSFELAGEAAGADGAWAHTYFERNGIHETMKFEDIIRFDCQKEGSGE